MKFYFEQPEGEWVEQGEAHLHIRFRPRNMLGVLLTILAHILVLWLILSHRHHIIKPQGGEQAPMVLILDDKTMNKLAQAAAEPKKTQPKPIHAPKQPRPVVRQTTPQIAAEVPSTLQPVQPPESSATAKDEPDMMSMIAANRARRQALEDQAKAENDAARQGEHVMTAQEKAEANVQRSMARANTEGTSGVFEIKSKSVREATFVFNGWKPTAHNKWRQVIQVDAGLNGDINLAIIRRMIEVIRSYYPGDFNWESRRLGRTVQLSARLSDQAQLERFLMQEFNFN
jgi:hypothetical protein